MASLTPEKKLLLALMLSSNPEQAPKFGGPLGVPNKNLAGREFRGVDVAGFRVWRPNDSLGALRVMMKIL